MVLISKTFHVFMALMTSVLHSAATTSYIRKTQRTSEQLAQDVGPAFCALGELLKQRWDN